MLFWEQTSRGVSKSSCLGYDLDSLHSDLLTISPFPPWLNNFWGVSEIITPLTLYKWMLSKYWAKCNRMRLGKRVEAIFWFENSACWSSIPKPVLCAQGHRMSLKSALGECSGTTLAPRAVQAQRESSMCLPPPGARRHHSATKWKVFFIEWSFSELTS